MSVPAVGARGVIAFQLVAALDRYVQHVDALIVALPDMDLYTAVSSDVGEIQRYASSIPSLAVPAVALLIAHTEFIAALGQRASDPQCFADSVARQLDCADSLRRMAMRSIPGPRG